VGPWVVQFLFPAPVLAEVLVAPIVLGFFDKGKFVLIFFFVH
jgi:hypothetical protein